jgi:hypothetical protein
MCKSNLIMCKVGRLKLFTRLIATLCFAVISGLEGCAGPISIEQSASVDLNSTGVLVVGVEHLLGDAQDKETIVDFYIRKDLTYKIFSKRYGRLNVIPLSPGQYSIGDWYVSRFILAGRFEAPKPLKFEIRPGTVTYIGTLETRVFRGPNMFGQNTIPLAIPAVRDKRGQDLTELAEKYPRFASLPTTYSVAEESALADPVREGDSPIPLVIKK